MAVFAVALVLWGWQLWEMASAHAGRAATRRRFIAADGKTSGLGWAQRLDKGFELTNATSIAKRAQAVAHGCGLADVENRLAPIQKEVHPGRFGDFRRAFFKLFKIHALSIQKKTPQCVGLCFFEHIPCLNPI